MLVMNLVQMVVKVGVVVLRVGFKILKKFNICRNYNSKNRHKMLSKIFVFFYLLKLCFFFGGSGGRSSPSLTPLPPLLLPPMAPTKVFLLSE